MKLWLAVTFIVFYVNSINAGLSPDERDKLIKAINKDRSEFLGRANRNLSDIKYDPELEEILDRKTDCFSRYIHILKMNNVWKQAMGKEEEKRSIYFLYPEYSIGCSKTFKCSKKITGEFSNEWQIMGKTVKGYGACTIRYPPGADHPYDELIKFKLPPVEKYADIIGVPDVPNDGSPGSVNGSDTIGYSFGIVFSLIFSLFLVFYV